MAQCGTGGWQSSVHWGGTTAGASRKGDFFFTLPGTALCLIRTDSFQLQNYPKCKCYFCPQVREAAAGAPSSPRLDVRGAAVLPPRSGPGHTHREACLAHGRHVEAAQPGSGPGVGVPSPGSSEATPTRGPAASCVSPQTPREKAPEPTTRPSSQDQTQRPPTGPAHLVGAGAGEAAESLGPAHGGLQPAALGGGAGVHPHRAVTDGEAGLQRGGSAC